MKPFLIGTVLVVLLLVGSPMALATTTTSTTTSTSVPVPPYALNISPGSLNLPPGASGTITLKAVWTQAGIIANASLAATSVPSGVSITFDPSSGPMPLTSIVHIAVSNAVVPGQYTIQFTSTVGYLTETASMLLNVNGPSSVGTPGAPLLDFVYVAFSPAVFRISYLYSNDVSISVKPLAQSNYLYKVGPTNATIDMPGSDNYVITISIRYPQVVRQNLSWSIVGGAPAGLPSGANSFPVATNDVVMLIHVSTVQQATVPTPTEVANALLGLMQNTLQQYQNQYQNLVNQNDQNFETIYVFMAVVLAALIALFSYVLKIARPRASSYEMKTSPER